VGAAAALALVGALIGVLGDDPASQATVSSEPTASAAADVTEPAAEPVPVSLPEVTPSDPQQPVTNRLTPRGEHAAGRHRHEPPKPRTKPGGHGKQRHDPPRRGNKAGKDGENKKPDKDSGKRPGSKPDRGKRKGKG
jgi:pyruvate/2-oxoglutarate dehydrogenase complex dihydrolipoamide acyltransferase (E2) component